ncbi:MAG TPA: hypothetical protein GXZ59_00220, partial [Clostridiaceae bacterium]|nr:hypothetical protein [Clostridiaceae bacterium]
MKSKSKIWIIMLLILSLLVVGCANDAKPEETGDSNTPAEEVDAVKIGSVLPLTGAQATTGANLKVAKEVAVDLINNVHD